MSATKVSISLDKDQLRRARSAAKSEGLSLSAYVARAIGSQLEDQRRIDAARRLYAEWGEASVPTDRERAEFLAAMSRPRKRRAKAA